MIGLPDMIFKKRGLSNKIAVICGVLFAALFAVSCSKQSATANNVKIYYVDAKGNQIESWNSEIKANTMDTDEAVGVLIEELSKKIVTSKAQAAISEPVKLKKFSVEESSADPLVAVGIGTVTVIKTHKSSGTGYIYLYAVCSISYKFSVYIKCGDRYKDKIL